MGRRRSGVSGRRSALPLPGRQRSRARQAPVRPASKGSNAPDCSPAQKKGVGRFAPCAEEHREQLRPAPCLPNAALVKEDQGRGKVFQKVVSQKNSSV